MTYEQCRTSIKDLLAALVTSGDLQRVYVDVPETLQDVPCAVLMGSEGRMGWAFGGVVAPDEEHTETIRLYVRDKLGADAMAAVRALRVTVLTALRAKGGLDGHGEIAGVTWTAPGSATVAARDYASMELAVTFVVKAP